MARIRKIQEDDGLFAPESLVRVSDMLYDRIKKRAERKLGRQLKKLTARRVAEKYLRGWSGQVAVSGAALRRDPVLTLCVTEIVGGCVDIRLVFPIAGVVATIDTFLGELAKECGIDEIAEVNAGAFVLRVWLMDDDTPVPDTRRHETVYGNGRKAFRCRREVR